MKKIILLLLFSNFNLVRSQTPSSCNVSQQLADSYYKDVRQLATFNLFQSFSADTTLVTIPQSAIDPIIEGMAAILNAPFPESDSVYNLYCVHNFNGWPHDYDGFLVQVDTNYSWTHAWQNLTTLTGDPLMDTILTRYDLHIINFYNWSFGTYALLSTDSAWNVMALIDTFEIVPGVLMAEQNSLIGNSGAITYSTSGADRIYEFFFEFNDCFDGCDNFRRWTFKVYPNCSVDYLGFFDYGVFGTLPLPPPVNCNLFSGIQSYDENKKTLSAYPNPSNESITITSAVEYVNSQYTICDISGRIINSGNIDEEKTLIDIHELSNGIYYLKISGIEKQRVLTFVKI